ncbi:MAG: hypothetical protein IJ845_09240 [Bacteroidaceae bacterium]|nr:hypothetical protein [Bacteroidaceae bacterium]
MARWLRQNATLVTAKLWFAPAHRKICACAQQHFFFCTEKIFSLLGRYFFPTKKKHWLFLYLCIHKDRSEDEENTTFHILDSGLLLGIVPSQASVSACVA